MNTNFWVVLQKKKKIFIENKLNAVKNIILNIKYKIFNFKIMIAFLPIIIILISTSSYEDHESVKRESLQNIKEEASKNENKANFKAVHECLPKPESKVFDMSEGIYYIPQNTIAYACNQNLLRLNVLQSFLIVDSCRFSSLHSGSNGGGAIWLSINNNNFFATRENQIHNCHFIDCSEREGGAIYISVYRTSSLSFQIINNLFQNNRAMNNGGAIYYSAVKGKIESNRFINNTAEDGGAIYFDFSINDKSYKSVFVQNNLFEHISSECKSMLCIYPMQMDLFQFSENTINITMANLSGVYFHVFNLKLRYGITKSNFSNNCIYPQLDENIKKVLKTEYATIDLDNAFVPSCPTLLPDDTIDSDLPIPDVVFNNDNCNTNNRCNYTVNEERITFVLVAVTHFYKFIQNEEDGGAIFLINCGINCVGATFNDCVSSVGGGGAIYIKNKFNIENNILLLNNKFNQCRAVYGGAVYLYSASEVADVSVRLCIFEYNENINFANKDPDLNGGSAIFVSLKTGSISECTFKVGRNSHGLIKLYNNFDESLNSHRLLEKQNVVSLSNCNFFENENSENSIYYINGNHGSSIEVNDCNFNGKRNRKSNYIEGKLLSEDSLKIRTNNCHFIYDNVKYNQNSLSKLNYCCICCTFLLLTVIFASLIILIFKKHNFFGISVQDNLQFNE